MTLKQGLFPKKQAVSFRRLTRQELGLVLLAIALLSLAAFLQLYLVSRVALTGREIQALNDQLSTLREQNELLQVQLSEMTAYEVMSARAAARGYENIPPDRRLYVYVDGYSPPEPALLISQPFPVTNDDLPPEYTQSLLDWVFEHFTVGQFSSGGY